MSGRHVMVESICEWCGNSYQVKRTKALAGNAKFCSKACFHEHLREQAKELQGYEKGKPYFTGGKWTVRWYDDTGKVHVTSYQKWWWENNIGEIPNGLEVYLVDGNAENISPYNFALGTHTDIGKLHAYKQVGRKHTEETKRHLSEVHSGKTLSEEHKANIGKRTKQLWEEGKVFGTQEWKEKLGEANKGKHSMKPSEESKKKMSKSHLDWYEKEENKLAWMETVPRGEKNGNWRDGASQDPYSPEFSKALRKEIHKRDGGKCRICTSKVSTLSGRVHHIDANKNHNHPDNLILLCADCHGAIHGQYKTNDPVILAFRSQLYT